MHSQSYQIPGSTISRLQPLSDPPKTLFCKGDEHLLSHPRTLGVVGSRHMSSYGKSVLESFIPVLVRHDIAIVSGLAFGVDITAHRIALDHGGKVIAVLGSGIDLITPRGHESDGNRVIQKGLLVSEYPGREAGHKFTFPARNRIIAGLSDALFVIEGTKHSGSLITADFSLQLGRDVLAIPGPIHAPLSVGPNFLIANGAGLIQDPFDVLSHFGIDRNASPAVSSDVSPEEAKILEAISHAPLAVDDICELCTLSPSMVNVMLTALELKGFIIRSSTGRITRL